jgi:hypothetical protein
MIENMEATSLSMCFTYDDTIKALSDLGAVSVSDRLSRLNEHLGITQVYGYSQDANGLTDEDHLEFSIQQLIGENTQRFEL